MRVQIGLAFYFPFTAVSGSSFDRGALKFCTVYALLVDKDMTEAQGISHSGPLMYIIDDSSLDIKLNTAHHEDSCYVSDD